MMFTPLVSFITGNSFDFFEYLKIFLELFKCRGSDISGIGSWDWNMSGQQSTYHALYPRAWTVYDGITITTEFSFG